MKIYVDAKAPFDGNGTKERPFKLINEAAKIAEPGDEVLVFPGTYRENVNPIHSGEKDARITYRSVEPLGAVITGAERSRIGNRIRATFGSPELTTQSLAPTTLTRLMLSVTGTLVRSTSTPGPFT